MSNWQQPHGEVITAFLSELNQFSENFILKGGTALMACYGLDRFSEDIDLDGIGLGSNKSIKNIVDRFCKKHDYTYRVAKDTETVKRYMLDYGAQGKPLKIEISFRRRSIQPQSYTKIEGVQVYTLDELCIMKAAAYSGRDKIRDLYDIAFICNNHFDDLSSATISLLQNALSHKGIEQFDYMIRTQVDELINNDKLAIDFLETFDKLGILFDEDERQIADAIQQTEKPSILKQLGDLKQQTQPPAQNKQQKSPER